MSEHVLDPDMANLPYHPSVHVQSPRDLCTLVDQHNRSGKLGFTEQRCPTQGEIDTFHGVRQKS